MTCNSLLLLVYKFTIVGLSKSCVKSLSNEVPSPKIVKITARLGDRMY